MALKDKLKSVFTNDSKKLEQVVRENAIYSSKEPVRCDIEKLFGSYELKLIGTGLNARTYKINDLNWVIKESKWDLSVDILGELKIHLPGKIAEGILKLFSFTFLPRTKRIMEDFKEYLEFAQYFGYFENNEVYYHPNRDLMFQAQKNIRNSLLFFKPEIEEFYKFKIAENIVEVLESDIKYHNFLPKEYLLIGKSISKENKGRDTAFIFQEFVKGRLLHDVPESELVGDLKKQMILLVYLILLMNMQIRLIPDTRPRYGFAQAYNWLTKTDNIMVTDGELIFIDTRWFWNTKSNLVRRGLMIPELVLQKSKNSLNNLLKNL